MKNQILILISIFILSAASALASEDTIKVRTHNKEHLNWNGHFVRDTYFPTAGETFRRIWLDLTIGCPEGGCSPWDYTVCLLLEKKVADSSINYELARYITAYSGNLNSTWSRTYRYDVTDYAPLLTDSAKLDIFYDGWTDGFTATVDFTFIKGTPARKPFKVEKLVYGSFAYGDENNPIGTLIGERFANIDEKTKSAALKTIITGHGFGGNEDCAEFCEKDNFIYVNSNLAATNHVWKGDCGMNPHYPQPGTWLFDRANWCPGLPVVPFTNDITEFIQQGGENSFAFDMTPFVNQGNNNCAYYLSSNLILFEDFNFTNNAALEDVVAPSIKWEYNRKNPSCLNPEIIISNLGTAPLTYLEIEYGVPNKEMQKFVWNGNLKFNEKTSVVLPNYPLAQDDFSFQVQISKPNNTEDENPVDNIIISDMKPVKFFPNKLVFELLTNNYAYENYYEIKDANSNIVHQRNNLQNKTYYRDTLNLPDGSYEFKLYDYAKNGLYWQFFPEAGSGAMNIFDENGNTLARFNSDFGTELFLQFQTGPTPEILISSDTLSFGDVNLNEEKQLMLEIEPANSLGTMVYEVKLNMIGKKGFSLLKTIPEFTDSIYLKQNEKMQIITSFLPTKTGYVESSIRISTNDPITPSNQIKLTGKGIDPQSVYENLPLPISYINIQENPITKPVHIEFGIESNRAEQGKLLLYNPMGELIDILFDGLLNIYSNSIEFNPNNYSVGAYILVFQSNSTKALKQVIILR